jgi:hypothetical protein
LGMTTFGFEPFREMVRLPCPGAHPVSGDVQQVRRLSR